MTLDQKLELVRSIQCLLRIGDYRLVGRAFREATTVLFRDACGDSLRVEREVLISERALEKKDRKALIADHQIPLSEIYRYLREENLPEQELLAKLNELISFVHITKEEDGELNRRGLRSKRGLDFEYESIGINIKRVDRTIAFPKTKP